MDKPSRTQKHAKRRRVAISLEMDWGFKRHVEVYAGCQRYADEAGWDAFIDPAADRELQAAFENGAAPPFDGVLCRAARPLVDAAARTGTAVVNVWINSPVASEVPCVFSDFRAVGRIAAEHLVSRGFRRFGYLGWARDIVSRGEEEAFDETVKRSGFSCASHRVSRTSIADQAPGWEAFVNRLDRWIDTWKPPIGVFVTVDLLARYLMNRCQAKGLDVSRQVAVVGCGNEEVICDAPPPTLTSIDMAHAEAGYRAAQLLDRLMDGERPPAEPEWIPPRALIPRQSTDSFAAADPLVAKALRFVAEHSHEGKMQVNDVAKAVGVTRRTLERRFSDTVGRSIAGEIARLRVERAKRRLVQTDEPLKTIAKDCGFRTADHFYKVFARLEGIPPRDYREQRKRVFQEVG